MIEQFINIDHVIFHSLNSLIGNNDFFDFIIKTLAIYLVYLVPIGLLAAWFFISKKDEDKLILIKTTIVSILMFQIPTRLIALLWYRERPILEVAGSKEVVFHVPSYSFPSDHATFFAALATYLYLSGYKKSGIAVYIAAFLVGISRVIGGFHFPLDVLAGWLLGTLGVWMIYKYLDKYIYKYIANPILKFMKIIKLA